MALSLSPLKQLNGERAVVLLYVIRILFSIPLSLLPEAFSLSFLSLFALSVEISADDASNPLSHYFRTRPGASSGILLGAVTLPGLLVSRLIQTLRAGSMQEVGIEEFEYLKLQYWAAAASCLTVLIFLSVVCQRQGKSTNSISSLSNWNPIYSFICIILLVGFSLVSLYGKLYGGWSLALVSLWVLIHGLAAVTLIQKILHMFPACASIGESLLVTTGLVIYFGDMVAYTAANVGNDFWPACFPMFYKYVSRVWEYFVNLRINGDMGNHEMRKSLVFYSSLTFMLVVVVPSWVQFVHAFHVHPLLWVFDFVLSEPHRRLTLCIYWLVIISVSVRRFYNISKNSTTERILLRKYYHLMAVSIFVPALVFQIWKIWPLGHLVHQFMNAFTDHRDSDLLVVSHFSLLLGCAVPIWLSSGFTDRPLAPFAGILSLGIGDTMYAYYVSVSIVDLSLDLAFKSNDGEYCVLVLSATRHLLALNLHYVFISGIDGRPQHWISLIVAVTTSGLLEAYTAQLDNAFIPLIFYSLLLWKERFIGSSIQRAEKCSSALNQNLVSVTCIMHLMNLQIVAIYAQVVDLCWSFLQPLVNQGNSRVALHWHQGMGTVGCRSLKLVF
ncbi:hypothetical protein DH2020_021193 [Rehmannia glutinosa]|uniref:dolichol kinase n=1 Tax=Rehmannia glutinosa TaxID=99300 RepID=A0ABR0WAA0_REHGL